MKCQVCGCEISFIKKNKRFCLECSKERRRALQRKYHSSPEVNKIMKERSHKRWLLEKERTDFLKNNPDEIEKIRLKIMKNEVDEREVRPL